MPETAHVMQQRLDLCHQTRETLSNRAIASERSARSIARIGQEAASSRPSELEGEQQFIASHRHIPGRNETLERESLRQDKGHKRQRGNRAADVLRWSAGSLATLQPSERHRMQDDVRWDTRRACRSVSVVCLAHLELPVGGWKSSDLRSSFEQLSRENFATRAKKNSRKRICKLAGVRIECKLANSRKSSASRSMRGGQRFKIANPADSERDQIKSAPVRVCNNNNNKR